MTDYQLCRVLQFHTFRIIMGLTFFPQIIEEWKGINLMWTNLLSQPLSLRQMCLRGNKDHTTWDFPQGVYPGLHRLTAGSTSLVPC